MRSNKIQSIQALRGFAMLLVLARHLLVMEEHYGGGERLLPDVLKAGDGGVDLFFVISGFIMAVISHGQFQRPGALSSFLYRRAIRIYPLYWLYSLVVLSVFLVAPSWIRGMQNGQFDLFASFFLLPQFFKPILGQGWTLVFEVYFYLIFSLALLLPERKLPTFLLVWGLALAVGNNIFEYCAVETNATIMLIVNPLSVEFILGACVALAIRHGSRRGDWFCLIAGCLLFPVGPYFFDLVDVGGLRVLCFGLPALLILYGVVSLEKRDRLRFPRWLQTIGDASYSIYLSHILVISAVGRIWSAVPHGGIWNHALAVLLMMTAALGFGIIGYRWIEQPLLHALQSWQPGRRSVPVPMEVSVGPK